MAIRCFDLEELAEVVGLEPSDPRRQHLEACPRCQALAMVFTEFLRDRSVPPESNPEDAAARLQAAFEEELSGGFAPDHPPARSSSPSPTQGSPRARITPRFPWLRATGLRPVLAAAVMVLVAGALYLNAEWRTGRDRSDVLRGAPSTPSRATATGSWLLPVETDATGIRILRWRAVPGADAYEVRFFGADLRDFARIGPLTDTLLVLRAGVLPSDSVSGPVAGWQVTALQEGQALAVSSSGTVHLR
jgi:hypothetical protein